MNSVNRLVIACAAAAAVSAMAEVRPADAQAKEARGTVTAVSSGTITVKAGTQEMTFLVDSQTHLEVRSAARDVQQAQPGNPKPRVNDFFQPGVPVLVRYREDGGKHHAIEISRVGSAGGSTEAEPRKTAEGKVKSVSDSRLIIDGNGHESTFAITHDTDVVARGATKTTKAAGGSTPITAFVHAGDAVSVSYREAGKTMTASEVRVRVVNH